MLGIDKHFFTRKLGYATTFCDLKNHSVYDVVPGRSEQALQAWLEKLEGKQLVQVVCMDLASVYRSLVRRHFPQARIVADRFHVIRIVNHHFLACWKELDPQAARNRGLLSLMRRHRHNLKPDQYVRLAAYLQTNPLLELVYRFKQKALLPAAGEGQKSGTLPQTGATAAPHDCATASRDGATNRLSRSSAGYAAIEESGAEPHTKGIGRND
jgi:transposase